MAYQCTQRLAEFGTVSETEADPLEPHFHVTSIGNLREAAKDFSDQLRFLLVSFHEREKSAKYCSKYGISPRVAISNIG